MKTKIILLFLIISAASIKGYAKNNEPKQDDKKTAKTTYDFTIFKLFSINQPSKADSTKTTFIKTPLKKED